MQSRIFGSYVSCQYILESFNLGQGKEAQEYYEEQCNEKQEGSASA